MFLSLLAAVLGQVDDVDVPLVLRWPIIASVSGR